MGYSTDITKINPIRIAAPLPNNLQSTVLFATFGGSNLTTYEPVSVASLEELKTKLANNLAQNRGALELQAKAETYFANNGRPFYLADLNPLLPTAGTPAAPVYNAANAFKALKDFLTEYPSRYYVINLPDGIDQVGQAGAAWDANDESEKFFRLFDGIGAMQYFTIKTTNKGPTAPATTPRNTTEINKAHKCVLAFATSGDYPENTGSTFLPYSSNHIDAAFMAQVSKFTPSIAVKATTYAYRILAGVSNNDKYTESIRGDLISKAVNFCLSGTEGGILSPLLYNGTTGDKQNFSYWYAADWAIIQTHLATANEIINGANNSANPLRYNQDGIDRLYQRIRQEMNRGTTYGLFGSFAISSVSYTDYKALTPNDVAKGEYNGFQVSISPESGIRRITFNLVISDIPVA